MQSKSTSFNDIRIPSGIKGVFLDLDNTLYIYEPCHEKALQATLSLLEESVGHIPNFLEMYEASKAQVKSHIPNHGSSHNRLLYFQNLLELIGVRNQFTLALKLEQIYWSTFLTNMELVSGAREFLADCQTRGTKIAVVSDLTTQIQCKKLITLNIEHLIDYLITSEQAGANKPAAEPFLLALKKTGLKPDQAVMIGDSLEKDVAGAQALGLHAIHIVHTQNNSDQTLRQDRGG